VIWAVQRALFGAQDTKPPAIETAQAPMLKHDGIFGRDHPGASLTDPRLLLHRGDFGTEAITLAARLSRARARPQPGRASWPGQLPPIDTELYLRDSQRRANGR
jgi:hypothetical protein